MGQKRSLIAITQKPSKLFLLCGMLSTKSIPDCLAKEIKNKQGEVWYLYKREPGMYAFCAAFSQIRFRDRFALSPAVKENISDRYITSVSLTWKEDGRPSRSVRHEA